MRLSTLYVAIQAGDQVCSKTCMRVNLLRLKVECSVSDTTEFAERYHSVTLGKSVLVDHSRV